MNLPEKRRGIRDRDRAMIGLVLHVAIIGNAVACAIDPERGRTSRY